jgi:hypothetical protein
MKVKESSIRSKSEYFMKKMFKKNENVDLLREMKIGKCKDVLTLEDDLLVTEQLTLQ